MDEITAKIRDMVSSQTSGNAEARTNALKGLKDVKENEDSKESSVNGGRQLQVGL